MAAEKWVEIDAEAVIQNLLEVKSILNEEVRLIAVVKANAYGHGAAGTASILEDNGVNFFAVTYLEEALRLRKSGIDSDIMLLSPLSQVEQVIQAAQNNIILTLSSTYDSKLAVQVSSDYELAVKVHLKLETGLGRFGLERQEALEVCRMLSENPFIRIEGIYTHMAEAASLSYTRKQFQVFSEIVLELETHGYNFPLKHCANSAVCLKYPQMHLDAVRCGTLLTGQYPVGVSGELKLADPFKFKCRVIALKILGKGSFLGYYRAYRLKREAEVAVIPTGYIDGLALEVGNKPAGFIDLLKTVVKTILNYMGFKRFNRNVVIGGKSFPVRGKVFMQMALVEIPAGENIKVGDEVEVPVRKTLVHDEIPRFYHYQGRMIPEEQICQTGTALRVREGEYA